MLTIDESYVDSAAPNAAAIKNGRSLLSKFVKLQRSEDGTLLFGECKGSGKEPYQCSSDFLRPDAPVHRCTCPSRQFPCKHCLGLMYAYVLGKPFSVAEVPEDIASKRAKAEVRAEKKKERADQPVQVNKEALAKKIQAQLKGLDLLETLTNDLVRLGMGNTSSKTASQIEAQAKRLGDTYLPGAQAALRDYTRLFAEEGEASREAIYSDALDQLTRLHALVKKGRELLHKQADDPDLKPDTESSIAAWLGHAWKLQELKAAGCVEENVELVQLAFHAHDDVARQAYVETGTWMNLGSGRIQLTQNIRPYQAAKHIKSDDSFFQVAQVPELCVYPGDINPRIRWESMVPRPASAADFARVRELAARDASAVIKEVRGHLKAPLADRHPVYAMHFARIGRVGDELVLEDAQGNRLALTDDGMREEPETCYLLGLLAPALLSDNVMVCRFRHDLDARTLRIKPLAIVTRDDIVRLAF